MNANERGPTRVAWGPLGPGGCPRLSHVPAVKEADGQPPEREHADVPTATTATLTYGDLTLYPEMAVYLEVERAAQQRKNDGYAAAVDRLSQDGDYVAFLAGLAATSREYRVTLRQALRKLLEAICKGEAMDEAQAEIFWYLLRLSNGGGAVPAA